MKNYIVIVIFTTVQSFGFGQFLNEVKLTNGSDEIKYNYKVINDDLYSIGTYYDTNWVSLGHNFIEFKKYDNNFDTIFTTKYQDSSRFSFGFYGCESLNENIYHCGSKFVNGSSDREGFILKLDQLGNKIWEIEFDSLYNSTATSNLAIQGDHIFSTSVVTDPKQAGLNAPVTWVHKIDTLGNVIWDLILQNVNAQSQDVISTSDGGIIVSTTFQGVTTQGTFLKTQVYKISNTGIIQWQRTLGSNINSHALGFAEIDGNKLLGYGLSEKLPTSNNDFAWLVELNLNSGQINLDTTYALSIRSSFNIDANFLEYNNNYYILGKAEDNNMFNRDFATLTCMTKDYEILWTRMYGERMTEQNLYSIFEKDGYLHMQGLAHPDNAHPTYDEWFMVVDDQGCDDASCTVSIDEHKRGNQKWLNAYPNPTQSQIQVSLTNPSVLVSDQSYVLTDLQGRVVLKGSITSSYFSLDLSSLSRGVYLLSIRSESKVLGTERIVLEK
ncbi:MAG: hypothetical protein ACI9N1_000570 [Flavobacteriales bacterium]